MKQTPSVGGVETVDPLVETLVGNPLPGRPGLPLVEDWDCLRVSSHALSVFQEALMVILQYQAYCLSGRQVEAMGTVLDNGHCIWGSSSLLEPLHKIMQ